MQLLGGKGLAPYLTFGYCGKQQQYSQEAYNI